MGVILGFLTDTINTVEDNLILSDKPFYNFNGININTASIDQLKEIGLSSSQANAIRANQGRMCTYHDLPVDLREFDDKITLYTNINTANRLELESLSTGLSQIIINDIITYRSHQPFGSYDELLRFFDSKGLLSVYYGFSDFIVIR